MRSFPALVRQVHLLCGLVLAVVACFYVISGAAILLGPYLPGNSATVETVQVPLPPEAANADRTALRELIAVRAGIRGRVQPLEAREDGSLRLRAQQPGLQVAAVVGPDRASVTVTRTRHGALRVLRTLHTLTGYDGGLAYVAWSLLLDLVSLAMIGFAATGIFLWYRLVRNRRWGWIVLGGSWGYMLAVIGYLALG